MLQVGVDRSPKGNGSCQMETQHFFGESCFEKSTFRNVDFEAHNLLEHWGGPALGKSEESLGGLVRRDQGLGGGSLLVT